MKIIFALFSMIFGLVFALAGVFMATKTVVPTYQSWQATRHWQPTLGTLISVSGDDNETKARYRYTIDRQSFENNRVYVAAFNDNIGSYHDNLLQKLERHYQMHRPVTIWYNPGNPQESMIDREMRWGLFTLMLSFCGIFILIGGGICWISLKSDNKKLKVRRKPSLFKLRSEWKQKQTEPNFQQSFIEYCQNRSYERAKQVNKKSEFNATNDSKTWMQKKEWAGNRIRSGAKNAMHGWWVFAAIWTTVCIPMLFLIPDELEKGNYAVLTILLFPLVGLFLIKQAWKVTHEWRRFGVIELEMDPFPGSIGGHVGGSLYLKNIRGLDNPFKVQLECVYSYVSGSGKNRSRRERIEWTEAGSAKIKPTVTGIKLNFRFDLPDDLPEADIEQRDDYFHWRLQLTADIDGSELSRSYNIPVFRTQAESRFVRHDISAQVEQVHHDRVKQSQAAILRGDLQSTALAKVFRFRSSNGEMKFYFPMFRNRGLTLVSLVFGGCFGFAAISMNQNFGDGFMGFVIIVFSIPFALVALIGSIAAVYLPLNNLKVSITAKGIKAIRRLFIFPLSRNLASSADITKIQVKSTGSTGEGVRKVKHHKVVLHTKNRKPFTIAEGIDGEDLANQLRDFIAKNIGKPPTEIA